MRIEDVHNRAVIEQIIVSGAVIRQADKLPPEMVEQHREVLASMGLVAELVANLPVDYWISLLDIVDQKIDVWPTK